MLFRSGSIGLAFMKGAAMVDYQLHRFELEFGGWQDIEIRASAPEGTVGSLDGRTSKFTDPRLNDCGYGQHCGLAETGRFCTRVPVLLPRSSTTKSA